MHYIGSLFTLLDDSDTSDRLPLLGALRAMLCEAAPEPLVHNLLANVVIRFMASGKDDASRFFRAFNEHKVIVEQLPYSDSSCRVFHSDARRLPVNDGSVGLIVTSPPYINVFN